MLSSDVKYIGLDVHQSATSHAPTNFGLDASQIASPLKS